MTASPRAREGIYRRISLRMYGDEKFMRLSPLLPSGQALWFYLLTGPHTGPIPGVFVAGRAALAEALGWDLEAFDTHLAELMTEGLVEFDKGSRLWFIPNAIRHNMPQNPNVVTSWRTQWMLLPECSMRDRIHTVIAQVLYDLSEAFGKAFGAASGKAFEKDSSKPLLKASGNDCPNQEAGSRKQEQEDPPPPTRVAVDTTEVFAMVSDWTPSPAFTVQAKLAGVPIKDEAFIDAGRREFTAYWLTRPEHTKTQAEWEHALAKSLKRDLARAAAVPRSTPARRPSSHTGFESKDYTAGVNADGSLA